MCIRDSFNFIYRSVSRRAVAEEIAQDVWLALIAASSGYKPGSAVFRTWLYRIARNKIADFYRRSANHHVCAAGDFTDRGNSDKSNSDKSYTHKSYTHKSSADNSFAAVNIEVDGGPLTGNTDSDVEKNLLVNQLLDALDCLPAEQREAFILHQEGFTAKEIAEITGATKEAIKSRLRYAKSTTRTRLEIRA